MYEETQTQTFPGLTFHSTAVESEPAVLKEIPPWKETIKKVYKLEWNQSKYLNFSFTFCIISVLSGIFAKSFQILIMNIL